MFKKLLKEKKVKIGYLFLLWGTLLFICALIGYDYTYYFTWFISVFYLGSFGILFISIGMIFFTIVFFNLIVKKYMKNEFSILY